MRTLVEFASLLPAIGLFGFFSLDAYRNGEYNFSAAVLMVFTYLLLMDVSMLVQ